MFLRLHTERDQNTNKTDCSRDRVRSIPPHAHHKTKLNARRVCARASSCSDKSKVGFRAVVNDLQNAFTDRDPENIVVLLHGVRTGRLARNCVKTSDRVPRPVSTQGRL